MKKQFFSRVIKIVLVCLIFLSANVYSQYGHWDFMGLDTVIYVDDLECFGESEVLLAGYPGLIYYSSNSGADWAIKNEGLEPNRTISSIGIDSRGNFYCTNNEDIYKSEDHAKSWFIISESIPLTGFGPIFVGNNDFIYLSENSGMYRSEDYGHSWIKTGYPPGGPLTMAFDSKYIYAGSCAIQGGGFYRSSDFGDEWTSCVPQIIASICSLRDGVLFGISWSSEENAAIFSHSGDSIYFQNSWPYGINNFNSVKRDRDGRLYTISSHYYSFSRIISSSDDGINWNDVGYLYYGGVRDIAIDSSGFIYAFVDGKGIYRYSGPTVPVELVNFSCSVVGGKVLMNWKTATETNNFGFEIEREAANNSWSKIAFVEGHGTTTREHAYQFEDNPGPGIFRYRLKQIDLDGKYEIFTGDKVEITADEKYQLSAYPNPFNGEITLLFNIQEEGRGTVVIYDILGNEVLKISEYYNPGAVTKKVKMPENVSSGIYFVRLNLKNETRMKKILLMK